MTAAKRALLYLTRKKGRSILLVLIIFSMSSFIMVGAALKVSADKESEKVRQNLGSSFILALPVENELYIEPAPEPAPPGCNVYVGPQITEKMIHNILKIDGVTEYFPRYYSMPVYTSLKLKPGAYAKDNDFSEFTEKELQILQHKTYLIFGTEGKMHRAFRTGSLEIVDGRNTQKGDKHKVVVSEYFSEKNRLAVGDTFVLHVPYTSNKLKIRLEGKPIKVEIIGVFHTNIEQEPSTFTLESQYIDNFIFSDFNTGKEVDVMYTQAYYKDCGIKLNEAEYKISFEDITFFVDDPQKLDGIMQEIKESDYFERGLLLLRDDTSYQASLAPLKTISVLAMILLAVGSVGCMVILVLLLTMWIKSRKREIGILISIGISKGKIMLQMLIECLTLSLVGVILTIILSGTTINGCCKIAEQLTTPPENQVNYAVEFDSALEPHFNKISADAVQLEYDYSARDAILLIIAVCGISSGSVLVASRQIMKMEPQSLFQIL